MPRIVNLRATRDTFQHAFASGVRGAVGQAATSFGRGVRNGLSRLFNSAGKRANSSGIFSTPRIQRVKAPRKRK